MIVCEFPPSSSLCTSVLSPGIGSSLTGGEGCRALVSLPADQLPQSRPEEEEEEEGVITGAKAFAWGVNEQRQEERERYTPSTPSALLLSKWCYS